MSISIGLYSDQSLIKVDFAKVVITGSDTWDTICRMNHSVRMKKRGNTTGTANMTCAADDEPPPSYTGYLCSAGSL
ncbi:hypothetical protein MMC25_000750 [Agyrium rufum]|nr:hypothetical protein [Agyrium rufum]